MTKTFCDVCGKQFKGDLDHPVNIMEEKAESGSLFFGGDSYDLCDSCGNYLKVCALNMKTFKTELKEK